MALLGYRNRRVWNVVEGDGDGDGQSVCLTSVGDS